MVGRSESNLSRPFPLCILERDFGGAQTKEWLRYCRKVCRIKMAQNGQNDHFGQNDLIPNWNLAFERPKWTKMVHLGPFWSILVHLGPPTVLWPLLTNNRVPKRTHTNMPSFESSRHLLFRKPICFETYVRLFVEEPNRHPNKCAPNTKKGS